MLLLVYVKLYYHKVMKVQEKQEARNLRTRGWSMNQIQKELSVSKSSISLWVRDIDLTSAQRQQLSERGRSKESIELRRKSRLRREEARRQVIIDGAKNEIQSLSRNDLFLFGVALYWAEGSKTKRGSVELSNTDPMLIKVAMRFFRDICNTPEPKFRGHVYLHPHLDRLQAERYWSAVSGISRDQFFKTSMQQSRASKGKRDTLPYGTFAIVICSTELFLKIKGWTEGLAGQLVGNVE